MKIGAKATAYLQIGSLDPYLVGGKVRVKLFNYGLFLVGQKEFYLPPSITYEGAFSKIVAAGWAGIEALTCAGLVEAAKTFPIGSETAAALVDNGAS